MEELKPCPFCGGKAKLLEGDWSSNDHGIYCQGCSLTVDPSEMLPEDETEGLTSKEIATKVWNRRYEILDVRLVTSEPDENKEENNGT